MDEDRNSELEDLYRSFIAFGIRSFDRSLFSHWISGLIPAYTGLVLYGFPNNLTAEYLYIVDLYSVSQNRLVRFVGAIGYCFPGKFL